MPDRDADIDPAQQPPPVALHLPATHVAFDKPGWRAYCRRQMRAVDASVRRQHGALLADQVSALALRHNAAMVALYSAIGSEIDSRPLANALVARGISLAYPRLAGNGTDMDFVACQGPAYLQPRPRSRLMEPQGAALPLERIDLVVIPAMAVDDTLVRLGRGGGYYDRWLPRLRDGVMKIAVVPSTCVVAWSPVESHDVRVDAVCTEHGLFGPAKEAR